ncbi:MAG: cell division protein FtsL [Thermodesulfobacteriota bacterium]|nr:cell division protein FtsL [Thermodesulfobacteriota bacterium]
MEKDIRHIKNIRTWIIFLFVFIALLLIYTWCRIQCVQTGYEISKAVKINEQRMARNNNLKIEHAWLKSPERIATKAKEELGLIMPTAKQIIVIP